MRTSFSSKKKTIRTLTRFGKILRNDCITSLRTSLMLRA